MVKINSFLSSPNHDSLIILLSIKSLPGQDLHSYSILDFGVRLNLEMLFAECCFDEYNKINVREKIN